MKKLVFSFAMLALIAVMVFSAAPSFASSQPIVIYSNWGTLQQPMEVRPGYNNVPFTVEFANLTTSPIYAQLNLSSTPFTNSTGGSIVRSTLSTPALFTFILNVKSNAAPGTYSIPIELVVSSGSTYLYHVSAQVSSPPSVTIEESYWGNGASIFPYPGYGVAPLTVLVSNPDSGPISHVSVSVQLPNGLQSQTGSNIENFYLSEIPPGSYEPASTSVNISQNSTPGTYYEPYTISYTDSAGAHFFDSGIVEVVIYPETHLAVNLNRISLVQGQYRILNISVKNKGFTPVYDLAATVQAQGIELIQGNTSQVSNLESGNLTNFVYYVYAPQDLPAGIYPISVFLQYESAGTASQSSYTTYVTVSSQSQMVYVSIYPGSIYYMRNNTIIVNVKDLANQELRNVQLQISPVQSIYISQGYGPFFLGNIKPYSEANFSLDVLPYFSQGQVYPFQITLQYQSSTNYTQTVEQTIPVFMGGIITINFSQVQIPVSYNGTTISVSGTILNSGNEEAYYGTVYINSSKMGIEQSQYIGDLPTDSPTPFSFSIYVSSTISAGTYPITLTYQYKDNLGNAYSTSYSTYIQVISGKAPATSSPISGNSKIYEVISAAIVIVIVIIAIVYVLRRLRR